MIDQDSLLSSAVRDAGQTREVSVTAGALAGLVPIVRRHCRSSVLIVSDEASHEVAGAETLAQLREARVATGEPLILSEAPRLKPRVETAQRIASALRASDACAIAVGSGVINDLVKYASALAERPYVCVATAASMDGYAASGAALLDHGFKRTLPCAAPIAVVADLDVLARAPLRMAGWGYGDLAGKVVAGADWTLGDALAGDAINPRPFAMVQDQLQAWLADPQRLRARDPEAFGRLLTGLLVSGFAMQAHGNSRPASGSDHQFSHLWEMEGASVDGEPSAHGACVGIGCIAMLALYEWLLAQTITADDVRRALARPVDPAAIEREIAASFDDPAVAQSAREEMLAKSDNGARKARLRELPDAWPRLRARLAKIVVPPARMRQRLRSAGGAANPLEVGVSVRKLAADHRRARLIRRRFTVLDLVDDLGWLDRAVDALFAPNGFWGLQAEPAAAATVIHR